VGTVAYKYVCTEVNRVGLLAPTELEHLDKPVLAEYGLDRPVNLLKSLREGHQKAMRQWKAIANGPIPAGESTRPPLPEPTSLKS
jgi:hypothetical protein